MNKPLILVVEDDAPVRNLITTTLKLHDYRFLTAANGETALIEASSHNPDIILLDLGLPDMDGIDIIRQIRSWSITPIIVISARSEDRDKIEALDAGADDYSLKPIKALDLISRIKVHLQYHEKSQYYENHDKGISRVTLGKIEESMRQCPEFEDIDRLEEITQIKKKTLYRYLQYLAKEGLVEQECSYGDMGRPRTLYRWKM